MGYNVDVRLTYRADQTPDMSGCEDITELMSISRTIYFRCGKHTHTHKYTVATPGEGVS